MSSVRVWPSFPWFGDWRLLLGALLAPPYRAPIAAAAVGLLASSLLDAHLVLPSFCGATAGLLSIEAVAAAYPLLLAGNAPWELSLAWLAMLVAMMTPLIAVPLAHVLASSLVERRLKASVWFLTGYFGCWMLAGAPIALVAILIQVWTGGGLVALAVALLLALLWASTPFRQAAMNRAHRLRRLGAFGRRANTDCLAFGAVHGFWCIAACAAWMLVPMMLTTGHLPGMAGVAGLLLAERLSGSRPPRWRLPFYFPISACRYRQAN